jgi:hypothetical protein
MLYARHRQPHTPELRVQLAKREKAPRIAGWTQIHVLHGLRGDPAGTQLQPRKDFLVQYQNVSTPGPAIGLQPGRRRVLLRLR